MSDGAEPDASNIIVVPPGACMSLPMSASTILLSVGVSSKRSDWAFRLPKKTVLMKKDIFIIRMCLFPFHSFFFVNTGHANA